MTPLNHRSNFPKLLFFSILLAILAFIPIMERPGFEIRNVLTPNRIKEISFLLASASLLTFTAIFFRAGFRYDRTPIYIMGSFSIWALSTTVWSDSPLYTFGKSLELFLLVYISALVSSIASQCVAWRIDLIESKLPYALLTAVVISIIANLVISGEFFSYSEETIYRSSRLSIGTLHPLATADVVSLTVIAFLASSVPLRVKTFCFILGVVLLVLTGSRGPIGVFLFAVWAMFFNKKLGSPGRYGFVLVTVFVVMISAVLLIFLSEELFGMLPEDFSTLNNRTRIWLFAVDIAFDHPMVGVGYFASRESLVRFAADVGMAHNAYIEVLLTTGIVGFGILFSFVVYGARKAFLGGSTFLLGVFVYVILRSILDPLLFVPGPAMFLLILGMTTVPPVWKKVPQRSVAVG